MVNAKGSGAVGSLRDRFGIGSASVAFDSGGGGLVSLKRSPVAGRRLRFRGSGSVWMPWAGCGWFFDML